MSGGRLARISIPKPCYQAWDEMVGDTHQRFCPSCKRSVHDLSALTRKQAERLVKQSSGGLCGRVACDDKGRMLFQPEPKSGLWRMLRLSMLGISASASVASASTDATSCAVELRVVDPANFGVQGAHVTLSRTGTSEAPREILTDTQGLLNQQLEVGAYELRVEMPGFSTYTQNVDVSCRSESPTRIYVQLQLGLMGEVVEVRPRPTNPFVRVWFSARDLFWRLRHSS